MTYSLWPHQEAVESLLTGGSAILWHEMRLGKTRSALHAYNQLVNQGLVMDLVVVTVAMAKTTWRKEVEEMGLSIPVFTCYGQKNQDIKPYGPNSVDPDGYIPRIYLLNWEILPEWRRFIQHNTTRQGRPFVLVLDEGHLYLRNPDNKRYEAALVLSKFARATWELTGTLLVKRGFDILYQAKLLGREGNPTFWMDEQDFGEEYCNKEFNPFIGRQKRLADRAGGYEFTTLRNPEKLMAQMSRISVLRIEDVAQIPQSLQLPTWIEDLGQAWDFYRDDQTLAEEIRALIPIKARLTAEYVQQMQERPVVVFGWHREFTETVAQLLEAPLIHGGTALADRDRLRDSFQAGNIPVLVGNLRSLGLGVSLSRADNFVYGEPYWDASLYLQAMARGKDLRKQRRLSHHHLLVAGSVEEYVWKVRLERGEAIQRLYEAAELQPDIEYP